MIKNRAFGDAVIGMGALQYLRTVYPNCHLCYGVPDWVAPLFSSTEHVADKILPLKTSSFSDYLQLTNTLLSERYDAVIELHQSGRTGRFFKVMEKIGLCPEYFAHNHNLGMDQGTKIFEQGVRKPILQRDLDTVYSWIRSRGEHDRYPLYLDFAPKLRPKKRVLPCEWMTVVLGVVATRDEKMWPLSRYLELIELMNENQKGIEFWVPLSGSEQDKKIHEFLKSLAPKNVRFFFKPMHQLAELLKSASFYVGNDTGLKHLCASLGLPTLTLFGSEEPVEWHPYDFARHPFLWIFDHDSRTEPKQVCALKQFDQSRSLDDVSAEVVFQLISETIRK